MTSLGQNSMIIIIVYCIGSICKCSMTSFNRKSTQKGSLPFQKEPSSALKQASYKDDIGRSRMPNGPHSQIDRFKLTDTDFGSMNPVVVTKRNISTTQNKRQNNEAEQDLALTNNFMRKKQVPIHTSHFNQTTKDGFKKSSERPFSKQELRNKGWNNLNTINQASKIIESERPQTSKGQRPRLMDKSNVSVVSNRKISEAGEQNYNATSVMTPGYSKKESNSSRVQFKTAIDADFLSLFAS